MTKRKAKLDSSKITPRTISKDSLPDDNNQFLVAHPSPNDESMFYDSWDKDLAIKMIALGYQMDLDIMSDEKINWSADASGHDCYNTIFSTYWRIKGIAESSISAGQINDPDTPANWISWANGKGYNTDHLDPSKNIYSLEKILLTSPPTWAKENYLKQIEGWKRLSTMWGLTKTEPIQNSKTDNVATKESKPKEKREHELRCLIKEVFETLNRPKNNIIWKALKDDVKVGQKRTYDEEEIIQEMDRENIRWHSWGKNEQNMSRKTFNNYLSELRNS